MDEQKLTKLLVEKNYLDSKNIPHITPDGHPLIADLEKAFPEYTKAREELAKRRVFGVRNLTKEELESDELFHEQVAIDHALTESVINATHSKEVLERAGKFRNLSTELKVAMIAKAIDSVINEAEKIAPEEMKQFKQELDKMPNKDINTLDRADIKNKEPFSQKLDHKAEKDFMDQEALNNSIMTAERDSDPDGKLYNGQATKDQRDLHSLEWMTDGTTKSDRSVLEIDLSTEDECYSIIAEPINFYINNFEEELREEELKAEKKKAELRKEEMIEDEEAREESAPSRESDDEEYDFGDR